MRLILPALLLASPAAAQVRAVPVQPPSEREALRGVEVFLINEGANSVPAEAPRQIEVTTTDGVRLVLERVPGPSVTVAAGGFAKARYVPVAHIPAAPPVAVAVRMPTRPGKSGGEGEGEGETAITSSAGTASGFLDRFSPHEPTYGAFGLDDSGGKLQLSFAFQPFGGEGALSHLRVAYTHLMFWRIDLPSGPFRNTVYSPEVYADVPVSDTLTLGLGYRHDSNGEGPADSIDSNRIFLRAAKTFDLGDGWRAELVPQGWIHAGKRGLTPDLERYLGNGSLTASVMRENGLKVALTGRASFETGRGAGELFVSYPLAPLGGLGLYVFGQAFTGYGESLNDYRRDDSHVRIGVAFTR
jgi:hypothetical protein